MTTATPPRPGRGTPSGVVISGLSDDGETAGEPEAGERLPSPVGGEEVVGVELSRRCYHQRIRKPQAAMVRAQHCGAAGNLAIGLYDQDR